MSADRSADLTSEPASPAPDALPAAQPGPAGQPTAAQPPAASPGPSGQPPLDPDEARRLARRSFFRSFAGDVVHAAATLAGAAGALRETTREMADSVLADVNATGVARPLGPVPGVAPGNEVPTAPGAVASPGPQDAPPGFRSPFRLEADRLVLLDQRRLPDEIVEVSCESAGDVAQAIREMVVRGAPALGQVAAAGLALAAGRATRTRPYARRAILRGSANALVSSRPTAVSIKWATDRIMARYAALGELVDDGEAVAAALREEAEAIIAEATSDHARMARLGVELLPEPEGRPLRLLTHCNTGPLAAGQIGTALGVVQALAADGRAIHVYADETRPWLQGARLTAWELGQAGIPYTLLADSAAGWLLAQGEIDAILVGADRIAANGDTANKVGTYPLAVLAARHGVPFYFVAPTATLDGACVDGSQIQVEMRSPGEVLSFGGRRVAPAGASAVIPSFDVTPAELITAIVTEEGVLRPPFEPAIAAAIAARDARRPFVAPPPAVLAEPAPAEPTPADAPPPGGAPPAGEEP